MIVKELKEINLSNLLPKKITNLKSMFFKCKKLKEIDLSNFDTSNVTNIGRMFAKMLLFKKCKT